MILSFTKGEFIHKMLNEQTGAGGGTSAQRTGPTPIAIVGTPVQYDDNGRLLGGQIIGVNLDGSAEVLVERPNAAFTAHNCLYGMTPECWRLVPGQPNTTTEG